MSTRSVHPRWRVAVATCLLVAGSLTTTGCGGDDRGGGAVQERQVTGDDKIGDAGLAPEEEAGGAGAERGTGDEAG